MASVNKVEWETPKGRKGSAWQVRYTDQHGKGRAKNFKRKKDADDFASEVEVQVKKGVHVPSSQSVTIREACEIWIDAVKVGRDGRPPAEEGTVEQYRSHVDSHIVPALGGVRLVQLTTPQVIGFRDDLLRAGKSRIMVKKILTSLKGVLGEAQTRGMVGTNAALPVRIVTSLREDEDVTIPSKQEVRALVEQANKWAAGEYPTGRNPAGLVGHKKFALFLRTKIATGMRSSEMRGLTWKAFDQKAATVDVFQRADRKGRIGPPKSRAGNRTIHLPADLVRDLKVWRLACPHSDLSLIFPTASGRVEFLSNILKRWWYPLQRAAGITEKDDSASAAAGRPVFRPKYGGLHVLRHFRASILIEQGADVKEVQRAMGHSSAKMTLDIYGHLFDDAEAVGRRKAIAEAANRAVFGGVA